MATALHHLTRLEQQRFTGLKGLPVLVGGELLSAEDRHHIVRCGERREIHLQRRVSQWSRLVAVTNSHWPLLIRALKVPRSASWAAQWCSCSNTATALLESTLL